MTLHDQIQMPPGEPLAMIKQTVETLDYAMAKSDNPAMKARWERLCNGETMAQVLDITKEEMEGLYAYGFSHIQQNAPDKGLEVFRQLIGLDPIEAKYRYCEGICHQMKGDLPEAARAYMEFLGLDATNFDGYMRLAECHLASGEPDLARRYFSIAIAEAEKITDVPGAAEALALARAQINSIDEGQSA